MPANKKTKPSETLEEGAKVPTISLASSEGGKVLLPGHDGKPAVVYFYPKDDTPGCTQEAKEFRKLYSQFRRLGVDVYGISPDTIEDHCKFRDKHMLNFPLLADVSHKAAEKFGVWVEKNMYGRKFMGVQRSTFLIGPDGRVAKAWPKVKPKGHAKEVFEAAKALTTEKNQ